MEAAQLFDLCSKFVLLPWIMLAVLPGWSWTHKLIFHAWIPMLLGAAYLFAFWQAWPFPENGGFGSPAEVIASFQNPWLATAGWIHYLAFDLFIGAWEVRDAQRHRLNHWLIIPCLFLTLMAGPVGLLLYFIIRWLNKNVLTTI